MEDKIGWGSVTWIGNTHTKLWPENHKEKPLRTPRRKKNDNIKMDLTEMVF
jgi:hypothetical protein